MHAYQCAELTDVEKKMSSPGKERYTIAHAAKLAEIQGLMDMDVMEGWTMEAVQEKGGKVISCKDVTTGRDNIGSGLCKARYVAPAFEERVDDSGWRNYALRRGSKVAKYYWQWQWQARWGPERKSGQ